MNYLELKEHAQKKLFIIGEAGVNHNGDINIAKRLVDIAKDAGCDAVKFQTWITEKVYSKTQSIKPDYQLDNTNVEESEYDIIKALELTFDDFSELKCYCEQKDIMFLSTPDEIESTDFLVNLGVPFLKTASQDVTNLPFLKYIAQKNIPVLFSTGGCTLNELVEGASMILNENQDVVILHCVSSYPAPMTDMNLNFISVLSKMFPCLVGFSDHTSGSEAACAAVALGARVVEKHFTLDTEQSGPDHQASLTPADLKTYIHSLRNILSALGDGQKKIMPSEKNTRKAFGRFLVSQRAIKKGSTLTIDDIVFKKVVSGIVPKYLDVVIGARAMTDIPEDTIIDWSSIDFGNNPSFQ
jgi:N,N'-diacetyllegionaminate synthase